MKKLPDEKTMLELLEMAKDAEQQVREAGDLIDAFSDKWQSRLKDRKTAKQNA